MASHWALQYLSFDWQVHAGCAHFFDCSVMIVCSLFMVMPGEIRR